MSNLERVLLRPGVQDDLLAAVRTVAEVPDQAPTWMTGIGVRRAVRWAEVGLHANYLDAMRIIRRLGSTISDARGSMSFDLALQAAWRRRKG